MNRFVVERNWESHGLECEVVLTDMGHRCGYVRVPVEHPWYGIAYNGIAPNGAADYSERTTDDAGFGGMIALLGGPDGVDEWSRRVEAHVAVHGGLTFSNARGDDAASWWFGFDCAHADDTPADWPQDRVEREIERMAEQIAGVSS